MPINLTQPVPGKTVEETLSNVISALRQQQIELEHYLSHLDTTSLVSYEQKPLTQGPSKWEDVATNFNIRNDRNQIIPSNPVIASDGTAIDHILNTDGSATISLEWSFVGTGPGYDIDGFIVLVHSSSAPDEYVFGTSPLSETPFYTPADMRAFVLESVASDKYYTFGVQSYRNVDQDVDTDGILKSNIIKPIGAGENPYRPSATVAFGGNIIGTINHIPVANIETVSGSQTKVDLAISGFIDGVYADGINSIQSQIDGKIESYFQEADPNDWAEADNEKHEGDMWYSSTYKQLKRWTVKIKNISDDSDYMLVNIDDLMYSFGTSLGDLEYNIYCDLDKSDMINGTDLYLFLTYQISDGTTDWVAWEIATMTLILPKFLTYSDDIFYFSEYSWEIIEDEKAIDAYTQAQTAQDTADGKRRVFTDTPYPPYEEGDLWAGGASSELKRCITERLTGAYNTNDWELATKYTDDTNANLALGQLTDMSSDDKITPVEKLALKQQWDIIVAEKLTIEAQATTFGITTEKTNYTDAYNGLNTYLNTTLELFSDMGATTTIARTTFNSSWESYYDKRQILQNKISLVAKSAGDNALQPDIEYNGVVVNTTNGLVITRNDDKVRSIFNGTDGIKIQKRIGTNWNNPTEMFYADINGNLSVLGSVNCTDLLIDNTNVKNQLSSLASSVKEINGENVLKTGVDGVQKIEGDIVLSPGSVITWGNLSSETQNNLTGDSIHVEYSIDGNLWHSTFATGDAYMRQKIGIDGVWSNKIKILGVDGKDGRPGSSANVPAWVTAWTDNVTEVGGTYILTPSLYAGTGGVKNKGVLIDEDGVVSWVGGNQHGFTLDTDGWLKLYNNNTQVAEFSWDANNKVWLKSQSGYPLKLESGENLSITVPNGKKIYMEGDVVFSGTTNLVAKFG